MPNQVDLQQRTITRAAQVRPATRALLGRFAARFSGPPTSFTVTLPDGSVGNFGTAAPRFQIALRNNRAVRATASLDEGRLADAYLAGDIDVEGDMLSLFALRESMKDFHPLTAAWRFVEPFLFGQVHTNKKAIAAHYEMDPEFFLSFLDPETPIYTQGVYAAPGESLGAATLRKFDYCYEKCRLKPGDRILEIGPGWGAWLEYAARRGVKCTGITISQTRWIT